MILMEYTGTDDTPAARGSGVGPCCVTCNRLLCQVIEVFAESSIHLLHHTVQHI